MALERDRVDKLAKELREREDAIAAGQMDTAEGPVQKWNEMVTRKSNVCDGWYLAVGPVPDG